MVEAEQQWLEEQLDISNFQGNFHQRTAIDALINRDTPVFSRLRVRHDVAVSRKA